jgi:hypothetical protein
MVDYWYPAAGHPEGHSNKAWFRVVEGWGFRTEQSPAGVSEDPCFRIIDDLAYPTLSMPNAAPTFMIVGSFAYSGSGAAWFRIERVTVEGSQPGARS